MPRSGGAEQPPFLGAAHDRHLCDTFAVLRINVVILAHIFLLHAYNVRERVFEGFNVDAVEAVCSRGALT